MKRQMKVSLVLTLGALLLSVGFASTAYGQQQRNLVGDTGRITLGPNQVLRISGDGVDQDDVITLRFRRIEYTQGTCNGGVCKHAIASQITSAPITLAPGESASIDIPNNAFGVRGVVLSNSRDVRVTAQIIDLATGDIIAIWVPQGSPAVSKD
jgi:hypothetical protein